MSTPPSAVFYVSGHGFGHASRVIEVINTLKERRPDVAVIVRTEASRRLFDRGLRVPVELCEVRCDTGMVQADSLTLDAAASIRQAAVFHRQLGQLADDEARFLRARATGVVVGDIPPLAFAAAEAARVPAVALGNFTWDWIYEGYPELLRAEPDLVPTIRSAYSTASRALRLPMAGGFEAMASVTRDIPFIARRSRRRPGEVRAGLGLTADTPLALLSFGRYGLAGLDAQRLSTLRGYTVITTDRLTGIGWSREDLQHERGSLVLLSDSQVHEAGYRYEDLVGAADVVVTKPGYGIISEAIANDTAILYTSRGRFVEYDVLVTAMSGFARCLFIDRADLLAGRWGPSLDRLLALPQPAERADLTGASAAADAILSVIP